MAVRYFCDICKEEITDWKGGVFKVILKFTFVNDDYFPTKYGDEPIEYLVDHDCYWKIQGFIKGIKNP